MHLQRRGQKRSDIGECRVGVMGKERERSWLRECRVGANRGRGGGGGGGRASQRWRAREVLSSQVHMSPQRAPASIAAAQTPMG